MTENKDRTDDIWLSPNRSTRERKQHDANAGIRLEPIDDRLSFFLRYTPVEPDASYTGFLEAFLNHVEGQSPGGEHHAVKNQYVTI